MGMSSRNKQKCPSLAEQAQQLQELSDFQAAEFKRTGDPLTDECSRSNAIAAEMKRRGLTHEDPVPADLAQRYDYAGIKAAVARRGY
jgi:hypothetical protein